MKNDRSGLALRSKLPPSAWLHYWHDALKEEIGLWIEIAEDQRTLLVNALYAARQEANDPSLELLMIAQPRPDVIFIAKKTTELVD